MLCHVIPFFFNITPLHLLNLPLPLQLPQSNLVPIQSTPQTHIYHFILTPFSPLLPHSPKYNSEPSLATHHSIHPPLHSSVNSTHPNNIFTSSTPLIHQLPHISTEDMQLAPFGISPSTLAAFDDTSSLIFPCIFWPDLYLTNRCHFLISFTSLHLPHPYRRLFRPTCRSLLTHHARGAKR